MYNTNARIGEYTPTHIPKLGGGRADRYAKFMIEEVKPFVDREYRVLTGSQYTGIGGFSLGGLVFLYLGLQHLRLFLENSPPSPALPWDSLIIQPFFPAANPEVRPPLLHGNR